MDVTRREVTLFCMTETYQYAIASFATPCNRRFCSFDGPSVGKEHSLLALFVPTFPVDIEGGRRGIDQSPGR
jgi:hypothetical protein